MPHIRPSIAPRDRLARTLSGVRSRRQLLLAALVATATACTRAIPRRGPPPTPELPPDFERWDIEARGMLSDALETLRTFEIFSAFRLATAEQTDRRSRFELAWDPPAGEAWTEAMHVANGLAGRSEQLFLQVTNRQLSATVWRQQRSLADATMTLSELAEALQAYQARVQRLPPATDATLTWDLLDRAWQRWETSAARWGISRAEPLACARS